MAQKDDEVSVATVAKRLGAHRNTVYRWVELARAGERSPLKGYCRADRTGHYWIQASFLRAYKKGGDDHF
jgi:hypothetical protein